MAYSNAIPQATDQLNDSQLDLLNNFIAIQQLVGVNHVNFNNAGESGKHTEVTLPTIPNAFIAAPTPTGPNDINIYSQVSVNTNAPELLWQRVNAGVITEMTAARATLADPKHGWSKFPSGLLIKWGSGTVNANPTVVAYPLQEGAPLINAPVFTNVFCVFTQAFNGSATTSVTLDPALPLNVANFTVRASSTGGLPVSFYYLAIGI